MTLDRFAAPRRRLPGGTWLGRLMLTLTLLAVFLFSPWGAVRAQDTAAFSDGELDQMLAPIALYPDSLLAQVLMAATYPADVKEAATWSKAHPDTKGDAAVEQVKDKAWEPSVASLVAFPQLLAMMGEKPDQVQKIGDAFLADPSRVMDRVQFLRKKAQDAGNLKTNEQQIVTNTTEANKQVIVVEPAQADTVYVPAYQPSVYGTWPYPAYPPTYWPPPPYYYPTGGAFVAGVFWGAAIVGISNGLWGGANWGGGDVNINVNKYNNINSNRKIEGGNNKFSHNGDKRGNVPYRDSKSRDQYGKKSLDGARDREAYRGKEDRNAQRDRASQTLSQRGADPAAGRERLQSTDRDAATRAVNDRSSRSAGSSGSFDRSSAGSRGPGGGASNNALAGARDSSGARANADRGQASRSSMSQTSARSGGAGGGSRGGGGGGRAGGGGGRR